MTPQKLSPRCLLHSGNHYNRKKRKFSGLQWLHGDDFRGVNDTSEKVSTVPMTPQGWFLRCQWHRNTASSFTGKSRKIFPRQVCFCHFIILRIKSRGSPDLRGLTEEKYRGWKISWDCPFKYILSKFLKGTKNETSKSYIVAILYRKIKNCCLVVDILKNYISRN
jgi:hypothetical protein